MGAATRQCCVFGIFGVSDVSAVCHKLPCASTPAPHTSLHPARNPRGRSLELQVGPADLLQQLHKAWHDARLDDLEGAALRGLWMNR